MALPTTGAISLANVNTEVGAAAGTSRGLGWVQSNTYYANKDLNSIRGLIWQTLYSSQNSIARTVSSATPNCAANCAAQVNPGGIFDHNALSLTNCDLIASVNCNQCGYPHGPLLQPNCNCACNCYVCNCAYNNCNCDCMGSCFPFGSMVLMASGLWKEISTIVIGDLLWSPHGAVECYLDYKPVLGTRPLAMVDDGSLSWSAEHRLWVKRDDKEAFWSVRKDLIMDEIERGVVPFMPESMIMSGAFDTTENFGHIEGWMTQKVVMASDEMQRPDLQLYLPYTGTLICVNGYLVSGAIDLEKHDYSAFKWSAQ